MQTHHQFITLSPIISSKMRQRTITAFFFAIVMLGGIFGSEISFKALIFIISAGCLWELFGLMISQNEPFHFFRKIWGTLICLLLFGLSLTVKNWNWPGETISLPLFVVIGLSIELFLRSEKPFHNVASYVFGYFYICFPLLFLLWIAQPQGVSGYMPSRILGLLLLVWTNDTGAYLTGRLFGKHKLFERISPKKTWEGTIGGAVLTLLVAYGLSFLIKDFSLPQWLALSVVAAIGSNIGDLVESMLKRSVGVKDSGTFMPGHGGFLDRFDAFIFCLPFFWLVLQVV